MKNNLQKMSVYRPSHSTLTTHSLSIHDFAETDSLSEWLEVPFHFLDLRVKWDEGLRSLIFFYSYS